MGLDSFVGILSRENLSICGFIDGRVVEKCRIHKAVDLTLVFVLNVRMTFPLILTIDRNGN